MKGENEGREKKCKDGEEVMPLTMVLLEFSKSGAESLPSPLPLPLPLSPFSFSFVFLISKDEFKQHTGQEGLCHSNYHPHKLCRR